METEIVACIVTEESSDDVFEHLNKEIAESLPPATKLQSNGQQLLRKRKQLNSFVAPSNPYHLTNTYSRRISKPSDFLSRLDAVTQRVLSGKDHRIKQLQSDLTVAQNKLCELLAENRVLRSLNKRNDVVLSRFQNVEAELPTLLSHHNSEIKSLRERFQKLSLEHREQARELRGKDAALQATKEQVVHLNKLIEDKGLKERHELARKLEESAEKISELEQQEKTLSRQLFLEKKSFKHQLSREQRQCNDLKSELHAANMKISQLETKLKAKEKFITDHLTRKEFHQQKSFSAFKTLSLNSGQKQKSSSSTVQKRVRTTSTVAETAYTSIAGAEEQEDDSESNLSFCPDTARQSGGSMMNQLNYTSSESDEDVSQIYRNVRPTSVPQLSLHTSTSSTPWAVDSRTFSIRQPEYYSTQNISHNSASILRQPSLTRPPSLHLSIANSEPAISTSVVDNPAESETASELDATECKPEESTQDPKVDGNDDAESNRASPTIDTPDNYSKEALLAALKAIDGQHNPESSEQMLPINIVQNHSERKADLMNELFGSQDTEHKDLFPVDTASSLTNS